MYAAESPGDGAPSSEAPSFSPRFVTWQRGVEIALLAPGEARHDPVALVPALEAALDAIESGALQQHRAGPADATAGPAGGRRAPARVAAPLRLTGLEASEEEFFPNDAAIFSFHECGASWRQRVPMSALLPPASGSGGGAAAAAPLPTPIVEDEDDAYMGCRFDGVLRLGQVVLHMRTATSAGAAAAAAAVTAAAAAAAATAAPSATSACGGGGSSARAGDADAESALAQAGLWEAVDAAFTTERLSASSQVRVALPCPAYVYLSPAFLLAISAKVTRVALRPLAALTLDFHRASWTRPRGAAAASGG